MPSMNRPNAPKHLPSEEFDNYLFKSRRQLGPNARSSVVIPSPLSSPTSPFTQRRAFRSSDGEPPPPSSPLALPSSRARPQSVKRSSHHSDSSARSEESRGVARSFPNSPYAIEEDFFMLQRRTPSENEKAWKLIGMSDIVQASISNSVEKAPYEADVGFRWKRDFVGGWLQVRMGRQGEPDSTPSVAGPVLEDPPSSTAMTTPRRASGTMTVTKSLGTDINERLLSETPDDSDTTSMLYPLQEGLYCRTKRALGLKHGPITPIMPYQLRSRTPTDAILDRVTSTLRFLPSRATTVATSAATSVSNLSIAAPPKKRHSRRMEASSSSSSVLSLLMGRGPAGTPEPEAMYTGSDSKHYVAVDLTEPNGPAFLPSEARRINTPPMTSESSGKHAVRGFFFDFNAPIMDSQTAAPMERVSSLAQTHEFKHRPDQTDWYSRQLNAIDHHDIVTREDLVATVPEHFPNSPLCPRNPKHQSGGMGTCPYHGRNKSTPSDVEKTPKAGNSGTLSPVQENWWMS